MSEVSSPGPVVPGRDVPVPIGLITHLVIVGIASPRDSLEEKWWLAEGLVRLLTDSHPALAAAFKTRAQRISFRTALCARAAGSSTQPDSGSLKAATDLLGDAAHSCCLVYNWGIAEMPRADGTVASCGFIFILGFPPPPGMKPWNYVVAVLVLEGS